MICSSLEISQGSIESFFNRNDQSVMDPDGYYIVNDGVPTAVGMDALEEECRDAWADEGMDHTKFCCQLMRNKAVDVPFSYILTDMSSVFGNMHTVDQSDIRATLDGASITVEFGAIFIDAGSKIAAGALAAFAAAVSMY